MSADFGYAKPPMGIGFFNPTSFPQQGWPYGNMPYPLPGYSGEYSHNFPNLKLPDHQATRFCSQGGISPHCGNYPPISGMWTQMGNNFDPLASLLVMQQSTMLTSMQEALLRNSTLQGEN